MFTSSPEMLRLVLRNVREALQEQLLGEVRGELAIVLALRTLRCESRRVEVPVEGSNGSMGMVRLD